MRGKMSIERAVDVLVLIALGMIAYGLWLVGPIVFWIGTGLMLLALAVVISLNAARRGDDSR